MSFMRALATVAIGVAAAKGIEKYKKMGGMAGMEDMMKNASSAQAGMTDQIAAMADKMGIPGGGAGFKDMVAKFQNALPGMGTDAGQAGLGGLLASLQGAAAATGRQYDDMLGAMTRGTPVSNAMEENAKLMIRSIIMAAKADGEIDEGERKVILEQLQDASPEERKYVEDQLAAPVDYVALAKETGDHMKAQVYSASLMAIKADNPAEVAYLRHLSHAMGMSNDARDAIHAAMGLPPLPPA